MGFTRDKSATALKVAEIGAFLEQRQIKNRFVFCYRPGGSYYLVNGKRIPEKEFEKGIPVLPPSRFKENYDKRKNFMHDKKSH